MISLSDLSKDIDHLDPLPPSEPLLAQMLADPHAGVQEFVKVIEFDPALTANALKLANSAYYSPGVTVNTVKEAVMRLGAGRILQVTVGHHVRGSFSVACPGYGLDEHELWRHCVASAVAADLLPRYARTSIHPVAFTAALLHDIGKLILARYLNGDLKSAIGEMARVRKLPFVEAERAVLGFDHGQVGGVIARRWKFPEPLAAAIAYHHRPRESTEENPALDAVHIANAVAKTIGVGMGTEGMNMQVDSNAARALGLTPASLESLCAAVAQDFPAVIALYEDEAHGL